MPQPPNGAGEAEVPPEVQAMLEAMVAETAGMLQGLLPHATPEELMRVVVATINEQNALSAVVADTMNPQTHKAYPGWGLRVRNVGALVNDTEAGILVPKKASQLTTMNEHVHYATLLGLLGSPLARAYLMASGFGLQFVQVAASAMPQRIEIVKG